MKDLLPQNMKAKAESYHGHVRSRNLTLAEQIAKEAKRKVIAAEKIKAAPKLTKVRGVEYVRADLAWDVYKRILRGL